MDKKEFALKQHEEWKGKIEVISRANIETPEELSVAYTPGVAEQFHGNQNPWLPLGSPH